MAVKNRTFQLSTRDGETRTVEADHYETRGDFVEFLKDDPDGAGPTTEYRLPASDVDSVELVEEN
jgi:hypothetical protein